MNIEELKRYLEARPYSKKMGAGLLAKRTHSSVDDVRRAKLVAYPKQKKALPKILLFDLETAPMVVYAWERFDTNIGLDQTISEPFILAYSAKWLYDNDVQADVLTPGEAVGRNDYRLVKALWRLLDEADIVVAYNGDKADLPWLRSRFLVYGMPPTKPFISVDPYKTVKRQFGFTSGKLDAIAMYLRLQDRKLKTDFSLWRGCMEGDEKSLDSMLKYNAQDVKVLEEVYLKLRPYITNHPNVGNILDMDVCVRCGSERFEQIDGYYYTNVNRYPLFRCMDCGSVFRGRRGEKVKVEHTPCAR